MPVNESVENQPNKRRIYLFSLTAALLIAALIWFLLWLFYLSYYEYTDDAYANGNMVNVHAAVPGSVVAFYADDTDLVVEGQLLVSLDCTDYKAKFDQELAALGATVLQIRQLYDNVNLSQAVLESRKIEYGKAKYDYENRSKLVDSLAVSQEEYIHSRDTLETARLAQDQAEYQLKMAQAAAGNTPLEQHPRLLQQKGVVRNAYYQLQHCEIYAPTTGYVAQRAVEVGQWAAPGVNLMAIIPTDYVWVDANYKETQLTYMRIGQPADVYLDIYGSRVKYTGKVLGIASGTGSVFSIIPPQNATGNWIKIVQRLPVRIALDAETVKKYPLRLGLSAEVTVDMTNQDLPLLATMPAEKPVATTKVFNLPENKIEQLMGSVIKENLEKKK